MAPFGSRSLVPICLGLVSLSGTESSHCHGSTPSEGVHQVVEPESRTTDAVRAAGADEVLRAEGAACAVADPFATPAVAATVATVRTPAATATILRRIPLVLRCMQSLAFSTASTPPPWANRNHLWHSVPGSSVQAL